MSNILVPQAGRATLDLQVDGATLLTDRGFFFDSAACVDSVSQGRVWTVKLQALSLEAYEKVVVRQLLTAERRVQLRWGIDVGTQVWWRAPENYRILSSRPQLQNTTGASRGYPFTLTLGNVFSSMDLVEKVVARLGRVSDLVEEIALDYQLEPQVEPTGGAPVALVQSYQTDLSFLQGRLLPAAVNQNGLAGYYCYADQGILHFHTRAWQQTPWVLPYNVFSAGAAHLVTIDDAQQYARAGGQDARLIAYDSLAGRTEVMGADPQRYLRLGQRLSAAGGTVLLGAHVGPNQAVWERARLQAYYARQRDQFERIVFSISNALDLRAGLLLSLQLPDAQASANGFYHVERVELSLQGGVAQAVVTAARGELAGRASEAPVRQAQAGAPVLPVTSAAPGVDPSFKTSHPASALGAGPSVSVRPGGAGRS